MSSRRPGRYESKAEPSRRLRTSRLFRSVPRLLVGERLSRSDGSVNLPRQAAHDDLPYLAPIGDLVAADMDLADLEPKRAVVSAALENLLSVGASTGFPATRHGLMLPIPETGLRSGRRAAEHRRTRPSVVRRRPSGGANAVVSGIGERSLDAPPTGRTTIGASREPPRAGSRRPSHHRRPATSVRCWQQPIDHWLCDVSRGISDISWRVTLLPSEPLKFLKYY